MACHIHTSVMSSLRKINFSNFLKFVTLSPASRFNFNTVAINFPLNLSTRKIHSQNLKVSKNIELLMISSVDQILSSVTEHTSETESVSLMKALRMNTMFKAVDSNTFMNNEKFKSLCYIFERNCHKLEPSALVSGLRSLLELGMSPYSHNVTTAEKIIFETSHTFPVFNLIGCLYYHHKFTQTYLQKKVVDKLLTELEQKVDEICLPEEVLMLCHIYFLLSVDERDALDKKIIQIFPECNTAQLVKVICILAEKNNRNIFLLNSLAFELSQRIVKPSIKETIDVFYACKKLNFFVPNLFSHIFNHIESQISYVKQASVINGLLTASGHMKWRHTGVLDACCEWINTHFEYLTIEELVPLVLTLSSLNYCPSHARETLKKIMPLLTTESIKSGDVVLDVAWSLAVLDCIPKQLLSEVLSQKFYKTLIDASSGSSSASNILKLLNLKGILKVKHPECFFGCDLYLEPFKLRESPSVVRSKEHVLDILSNFVPGDKFMSQNQVSDFGVLIDAEFVMNAQLRTLPLSEYDIVSNETSSSKTHLKNYKRVALLILFPKEFTQCSNVVTGVIEIGARLLSYSGYSVVIVPYAEFSKNTTEVQKTKYLSELIRQSLVSE